MLKRIRNALKINSTKVLAENIVSLAACQALNYILPLLTLPYLVRVLEPEKFGVIAFAQSFVAYFNILVDFGFGLSAPREVAINRHDKEKVTEIYSAVFTIKLILLLISLLILLLIIYTFDRFSSERLLYLVAFSSVVGAAFSPIWYFQGMEVMKVTSTINITVRSLFTILVFIVVRRAEDYIYYPALISAGSIISAGVSLWFVRYKMNQKFCFCSSSTLVHYFRESATFFWSRVSVSAYTSSNAFILGLFCAPATVGYYSIAERLYTALQQLYSPLMQALYPYVAKQRNMGLFKKVFSMANIFNVIVVIVGIIFADSLVWFVAGEYLSESVAVLRILLIALLVVVPSILTGYPVLAALGYTKAANFSVLAGSCIHVTMLCIFAVIGQVTIINVALLVIVTEVMVMSIRLYAIRKNKLWSTA